MARYFFDVHDGQSIMEDPEGEDFPDPDTAREEAVATAIDLVCTSLCSGEGLKLHRAIVIKDARRTSVEVLPFGIALQPRS